MTPPWRWPALRFVALGTALFVAKGGALGPDPAAPHAAPQPIVVTRADRAALRAEYARQTGLPVGPEQERALVERFVEEEILYREALARGLQRGNRSIRLRLVQKMEFLVEAPERGEESLYREALALDLGRDDPVIRRILVANLRLVLGRGEGDREPTDAELRDYLARHADRFRQPERFDLSQLFLDAARRGDGLDAAARELRARLDAEARSPEDVGDLGDPLLWERRLRSRSAEGLARGFGADFAAAVAELEPGRWSPPIRSPYGLHLVWLHAREPARTPELEALRSQLAAAWRAERREAVLADALAELRRRYPVQLEPAGGSPS